MTGRLMDRLWQTCHTCHCDAPRDYNVATGLMFACPITNQVKGGPFESVIARGARVTGVLANQLRAVDWIARQTEFHSRAPRDLVLDVLARIEAVLVFPPEL